MYWPHDDIHLFDKGSFKMRVALLGVKGTHHKTVLSKDEKPDFIVSFCNFLSTQLCC